MTVPRLDNTLSGVSRGVINPTSFLFRFLLLVDGISSSTRASLSRDFVDFLTVAGVGGGECIVEDVRLANIVTYLILAYLRSARLSCSRYSYRDRLMREDVEGTSELYLLRRMRMRKRMEEVEGGCLRGWLVE